MYQAIPPQADCASAWLKAVRTVEGAKGHEAHNVIIDVVDPVARTSLSDPVVSTVDDFLKTHDKKRIQTVSNTIFPAGLYRRYGAPTFFKRFHTKVLPLVRGKKRWSGYYFERMTDLPQPDGSSINQIWDIVERIRNPSVKALNRFELLVFDPARDVDNASFGGQCLSFVSLKLIGPVGQRKLSMTAMYRNHFYIEKLLGNLIGLGQLMKFIADEAGVEVGQLTIISTHAEVDTGRGAWNRRDLADLIDRCDQANAQFADAA